MEYVKNGKVPSGDVQMDKDMKQTKAAKAKAEEAALNRILCWITGGAVLEFLLLLLSRYWNHYTTDQIELRVALGTAVKILAVAALICAGAAAFWWNGAKKAGKGTAVPATLGFFMLGVSVSCFAAWFFSGAGLQLMYVVVPVVVVLVLIFYLYQREFFLVSCESALALLSIWVCGRALGSSYTGLAYALVAVCALVILAVSALFRKAQTEGGSVELGGRKFKLFPKDANYAILYAGAIILLLVVILAAIGINQMALYAVTVAWLLIAAVYYTVKLM